MRLRSILGVGLSVSLNALLLACGSHERETGVSVTDAWSATERSAAAVIDSTAYQFAAEPAQVHTSARVAPEESKERALALVTDSEVLADVAVVPLNEIGKNLVTLVTEERSPKDPLDPQMWARSFLDDGKLESVDKETTLELEGKLQSTRHGKFSHEAHELTKQLEPNAVATFYVVLDLPIIPSDDRAVIRKQIETERAPVLALLEAIGAKVTAFANLPILEITAPVSALQSNQLHEEPRVRWIDLKRTYAEPLSYAGNAAMGDPFFENDAICGGACDGARAGVGLWEDTNDAFNIKKRNAAIASYNPKFFGEVTYKNEPQICESDDDCLTGDFRADAGIGWRCLFTSGTRSCSGGATCTCGGIRPGLVSCTERDGKPAKARCVAEHPTWVAGSVGLQGEFNDRTATLPKIGAYNTHYYYAGDREISGLDWLLEQGLMFSNRSMTTHAGSSPSDPLIVAIDSAVRFNRMTISIASGNDGQGVKCGSGFNSVCVGGYVYNKWATRLDDEIWNNSSFKDPVIGRERPHVVAPAAETNGLSVDSSLFEPAISISQSAGNGADCFASVAGAHADWMAASRCGVFSGTNQLIAGTSFAAPAYLGLSLLALHVDGIISYTAIPIANKVVMLVGSEDANRDGPLPIPGVDGKDGAGAPDGISIKRILKNKRLSYESMRDDMFVSCGPNCMERTLTRIPTSGEVKTFRAALASDSCPNRGAQVNSLKTDFDLRVTRTGGACSATTVSSLSTQNETEMVQLDCAATNTVNQEFTIKIRVKGDHIGMCGGQTTEPIAVAWDFF